MDNLSLTLQLFTAGLIIGLFLSLPSAAIISGICEALQPDSSQHKVGLIMVMIYVPLFTYLMRNMTEVLPMVIGVVVSSSVIAISVMIKKYREAFKLTQSQQSD
jgi:nicotinamide riboside transporter PnuC